MNPCAICGTPPVHSEIGNMWKCDNHECKDTSWYAEKHWNDKQQLLRSVERVQELESQHRQAVRDVIKHQKLQRQAEAKLAKAVEALRFYAKMDNWQHENEISFIDTETINGDKCCGRLARQTLAEITKEGI